MAIVGGRGPTLVAAIALRTSEILKALRGLDESGLQAPSGLDGWNRLTIICHLRYGAEALWRMTYEAAAGKSTAYYPNGRNRQRPATLTPGRGEASSDVVESFADRSEDLRHLWAKVVGNGWDLAVNEPEDNPDLGSLTLVQLAVARLTEMEVHGLDLDLNVADWSTTFIETALPYRLDRLTVRRANHRHFDDRIEGSWLLAATDGPTYLVSVAGSTVSSLPTHHDTPASAVIEGSSRDLLALLLGRPTVSQLRIGGDVQFGNSFQRAFPGP